MVKEAVAKGRGVQEPSELAPGPVRVSAGRYQSWPQAPSRCLQEDGHPSCPPVAPDVATVGRLGTSWDQDVSQTGGDLTGSYPFSAHISQSLCQS